MASNGTYFTEIGDGWFELEEDLAAFYEDNEGNSPHPILDWPRD